MKVYEKFFRDAYRQICLLTGPEVTEKINLRDVFDFPPEEDLTGFLTYGFIDEETGFNFEILAGAKIADGRIKIFPGSYKKNVKLRRPEIEDAEIKILPEYADAFRDKIQIIDDRQKVDEKKERTRFIKTIDALRHPNFPDDVAVLFFGEKLNPEYAWVRCSGEEENLISGKLLHDLQQNFKYKTGDEIKFGVTEFENEIICVLVE